MKTKISLLTMLALILYSCATTPKSKPSEEVNLPQSVELPSDGSTPLQKETAISGASRKVNFASYGQKEYIKTGEAINIVYEGVDASGCFLLYESVDGGYTVQLAKLDEPVHIEFTRFCQTFIVAMPEKTTFSINPELMWEQIIWTPRNDGTWEVRIGSTNRGCKSEALDRLDKQRTREYNTNIQKTKIK